MFKNKLFITFLTLLSIAIPGLVYAIPINLTILPAPINLAITPVNSSIGVGATQNYQAIVTYSDTTTQDVSNSPLITWMSSNLAIATINNAGQATGQGAGNSLITASFGNLTSNDAQLTVSSGSAPVSGGAGPVINTLRLEVHPEKRHDPNGRSVTSLETNQDIAVMVSLFANGSGDLIYQSEALADDSGIITTNIEGVPDGKYDITVKSISHLNQRNSGIDVVFPNANIDLSQNGTILLRAGDVNGPYGDNYVNGLDYSVIANQIYSNDKKTDLNRDQIVNGIDFSITTYNIYQFGDQ